MFDGFAATTLEVAFAAGSAAGRTDVQGHVFKVGRFSCGVLGIRPGGVMTGEAIDVFFGSEIKAIVLLPVADMAGGTGLYIGRRANAEIIDNIFLAKKLVGLGIFVFPGPVCRLMELFGGFGVAFQAGPGHLRAALEFPVKAIEL